MSTVVEEPQLQSPHDSETPGPDLSVLTDKVPMSLRAPRSLAGMVLVLGLIYMFCCSRPVWHTDVWGHLSYGRYIWETKSLPSTEPLLPLAKGMPFIDSPWLCQLIGYAVMSSNRLQLAGLQGLFAIAVTSCCAMLAWRSYRQTRNGWFSFLSVCAFLVTGWMPLSILRPQLAGMVCFVYLLTRLAREKNHRSDWIMIPVTFALWANLHASFLVGLGLLACFCLGRAADVFRRTRSVRAALRDVRARRYFLLTELAAAAVLLNPYTVRLYIEALRFSASENLQDLTEWHPLTLRDGEGQLFIAVALALMTLFRLSPRRIRSWEILSVVGLGLATMWSVRMIVWWAPISAMLVARHGYAIWRTWQHASLVAPQPMRAGKWSFVAMGLVWICFMVSPLGIAVIHGKHTPDSRAMSKYTPRFAAEYLTKHPPEGLVFNTYEWGDYLQWAGPKNLQLFVNSHAHLIPRDVWLAYMQVIEQRSGWEEVFDKYGINTVILDTENRESLIKKMKEDEKWRYPPQERDGQVIFLRKRPIIKGSARSEPKKPAEPSGADAESKKEDH